MDIDIRPAVHADLNQQDLCARGLKLHTDMPAGMRMAEIVVHTSGSSELFSTRVMRADYTMH